MNLSLIARAVAIVAPETDASLTLAERPERLHGVWSPLEQILSRIESTGEIDTARGLPVFREAGCWFEVGPAVAGIVEFHERAQQRYGIAADTAALAKLAKKLEFHRAVQAPGGKPHRRAGDRSGQDGADRD